MVPYGEGLQGRKRTWPQREAQECVGYSFLERSPSWHIWPLTRSPQTPSLSWYPIMFLRHRQLYTFLVTLLECGWSSVGTVSGRQNIILRDWYPISPSQASICWRLCVGATMALGCHCRQNLALLLLKMPNLPVYEGPIPLIKASHRHRNHLPWIVVFTNSHQRRGSLQQMETITETTTGHNVDIKRSWGDHDPKGYYTLKLLH